MIQQDKVRDYFWDDKTFLGYFSVRVFFVILHCGTAGVFPTFLQGRSVRLYDAACLARGVCVGINFKLIIINEILTDNEK